MANPAPKIINFNFSYLIVSVRRPSYTCASFFVVFCVNLCHRTFVSATMHTTPADVAFSDYPRCSVPLCVVQCGVCVYVYVYVYMFLYMYMYVYMCVWSVSGKMVNAPWAGQSQEKLKWRLQEILTRKLFVILFFMGAKDESNHLTAGFLQRFTTITVA